MKKYITIIALLFSFNAFAVEYSSVISINATDKDAISAKNKAWSHANKVALDNVMKKISNDVSLDYLTDEQILNLIKETEVLSEKISDTRYIGKLKIVFNDQTLNEFLKEKNIQKINLPASKTLIIPLYKEDYQSPVLLWENENTLKTSFEQGNHNNIIKIDTIKANPENYSLINIDQLLSLDTDYLEKVAYSNIAQDLFIINAQNQGTLGLSVEVTHYNNGQTSSKNFNFEGDYSNVKSFNQETSQILDYINDKIKQDSLHSNTVENKLNVIFNFSNLHQWLWVKNDLQKATYIKDVIPVAMQNGRVEVQINYEGDYNQLLYSIKNKGLTLKEEAGYYILERI